MSEPVTNAQWAVLSPAVEGGERTVLMEGRQHMARSLVRKGFVEHVAGARYRITAAGEDAVRRMDALVARQDRG